MKCLFLWLVRTVWMSWNIKLYLINTQNHYMFIKSIKPLRGIKVIFRGCYCSGVEQATGLQCWHLTLLCQFEKRLLCFLIQLPANAAGKAMEDGPRAWFLLPKGQNQVPGSGFWQTAVAAAGTGKWANSRRSHSLSVTLSLSNRETNFLKVIFEK